MNCWSGSAVIDSSRYTHGIAFRIEEGFEFSGTTEVYRRESAQRLAMMSEWKYLVEEYVATYQT
jgi:hypothetical protein